MRFDFEENNMTLHPLSFKSPNNNPPANTSNTARSPNNNNNNSNSGSNSQSPNSLNSTNDNTAFLQQQVNRRKMWFLGIVSSHPPSEIMKEIFRALKVVGFVSSTSSFLPISPSLFYLFYLNQLFYLSIIYLLLALLISTLAHYLSLIRSGRY